MNKTKEIFITGFALFSMFFGAGNLILPPLLGFKAGESWKIVAFGFVITAVIIPIFGIIAYSKLQGTMFDFAKKVSPIFSLIYCVTVYAISIALPSPRTASVAHEMAIAPYFDVHSVITSAMYFLLVFIFVMNRSKILDILGKYLTPIIGVILIAIIFLGTFFSGNDIIGTRAQLPFVDGLMEGYQTFDAIGAVVCGGVIVISVKMRNIESMEVRKEFIKKSGLLAGLGLFLIYAGLIFTGAYFGNSFPVEIERTALLSGISNATLGNIGGAFLGVLVALACFTTAVGIVIGTADYFSELFSNKKRGYLITAVLSCFLGIIMGQLKVDYIIHVALPILMLIYPVTIVLILLNVLPNRLATSMVFKIVVITSILFSIPDFLKFIIDADWVSEIFSWIPLSSYGLAWVIPVILSFIMAQLFKKTASS